MGITYDELKKLNGQSVVLERHENIAIEQNANNFFRRKQTIIRENFPRQESKAKAKENNERAFKVSLKEKIAKALLKSFISEKEENKKIEEKLDATTRNLKKLKLEIKHEIKDLKQEQRFIKMNLKPEVMKNKRSRNIVIQNQDKTWSENFKDNETFHKSQQEEVMVEKYSQKHQCVCTSPRYTTNEDVAVRPKMRTIASQMDSNPKNCSDRGAVGDHTSLNAIHSKEEKVKDKSLQNTKELLLKPEDPSLAKNLTKDFAVNCCYGTTCCVGLQPCQTSCQHYCVARDCNGVICNQRTYRESGLTTQGEYKYCRDELYYGYPKSSQLSTPSHGQCICGPQCRCQNPNKIYGRPCSDLNTEDFCYRTADRSGSSKTHSTSKSKRDGNLIKKNEAKLIKEKKENKTKECRCKETCEEYAVRKKRECEEKFKKRERSKSKDRKEHHSKNRDAEEEKLRKLACEKILNESTSKLVELFDRYADEKDTSIGTLIRYLADPKNHLNDESGSTTSFHVRCEDKGCQISLKKKCTCPKHSTNIALESVDSLDDNNSRISQYSLETLQMLKKLKLREYKPAKPNQKTKNKESSKEDDEKSKRYKEYINKYRQEDEDAKEEKEQKSKKPIQKPKPKEKPPTKKQKNIETDSEEVTERYEYGPAMANGWDDYGRNQFEHETSNSQDKRKPKSYREEKSNSDSEKPRQSVDNESEKQTKRVDEGSKYIAPRTKQDDRYESNGDKRYDKYNKIHRDERTRNLDSEKPREFRSKERIAKDEKEARSSRERNYDQASIDKTEYKPKVERDNNGSQNASPRSRQDDRYQNEGDERPYNKNSKCYRDKEQRNLDAEKQRQYKSQVDKYGGKSKQPLAENEREARLQRQRIYDKERKYRSDEYPKETQRNNLPTFQQDSFSPYDKGNRQEKDERVPGTQRERNYDTERKYKPDEYSMETRRNHLPTTQQDSFSPYERGNRQEKDEREPGTQKERNYDTKEKYRPEEYSKETQRNHLPITQQDSFSPYERGNRQQKDEREPGTQRESNYDTEGKCRTDEYPLETQRNHLPTTQQDSFSPYDKRNRQQNDEIEGKTQRERNYDTEGKYRADEYPMETQRNHTQQDSFSNRQQKDEREPKTQSERYYDTEEKYRTDEYPLETEILAKTQRERNYDTEGKYRADEYPVETLRNHLPTTQQDSFMKRQEKDEVEAKIERQRNYATEQKYRSNEYPLETQRNHLPTLQQQSFSPFETTSPSQEAYENTNQIKQSPKYEDESPVNLPKPEQSEYEEQTHRAKREILATPTSSFEPIQNEQDYKETSQSQLTTGASTIKSYSSYDDGFRRNESMSKTEVTDQESFRTYTKSPDISQAKQREEIPSDKHLHEDFNVPLSQFGYTKYKQNLKTKYIQEQDGTEITHTKEQIFIDETYGQPTNSVPTNTEEAIIYLKNFLNAYEKSGLEENCLNSVSTATNDLINKLSACSTIIKVHSATSSPCLETYYILNEHPEIKETKSTETQYKDLESTSNISPLTIKHEIQTLEEDQSSLPNTIKNEIPTSKENGANTKENSLENTTIKNPVGSVRKTEDRSVEAHLEREQDLEKDNYRYETAENYNYQERLAQSKLWETEENYERFSKCQDNINHLHPPEEFMDVQHMLDPPNAPNYDQSSNPSMNPAISHNEYEYYCLPECPETTYNQRHLSSPSKVSQKSCCYSTSNGGTSSRSTEEVHCESELLPLKGILKSCRNKDTNAAITYDFESNKTTSSVSFGNEEEIKTHTTSFLNYTSGQERISQINDEDVDTLITKDETKRPLRKQSKITRSETSVKQPICEQIDEQQPCPTVDVRPLPCQTTQQCKDAIIPKFNHCPCMLDTYMKLLEIYCKDEDKFDFIKN